MRDLTQRPAIAIDPVCGMTVEPDSAHGMEYEGQRYGFCSAKCLAKFAADPQGYLAPPPPAAADIPAGEYTCPMHPEVRQIGPGTCPKCGMALEPVLPELKPDEENEIGRTSCRERV